MKQIAIYLSFLLSIAPTAFAGQMTHSRKVKRTPASLASSRCFGDTAPTHSQYLAKLAKGDACEDHRVPQVCEIKSIQKLERLLRKGESLTGLEMSSTDPLHSIDVEISHKNCIIPATIIVEYQYYNCTIKKIDIQRDQEDCG